MDATCLEPYHKHSHPIQVKAGGWCNDFKKEPCKHKNFNKNTVMGFSFNICKQCGYQWKA